MQAAREHLQSCNLPPAAPATSIQHPVNPEWASALRSPAPGPGILPLSRAGRVVLLPCPTYDPPQAAHLARPAEPLPCGDGSPEPGHLPAPLAGGGGGEAADGCTGGGHVGGHTCASGEGAELSRVAWALLGECECVAEGVRVLGVCARGRGWGARCGEGESVRSGSEPLRDRVCRRCPRTVLEQAAQSGQLPHPSIPLPTLTPHSPTLNRRVPHAHLRTRRLLYCWRVPRGRPPQRGPPERKSHRWNSNRPEPPAREGRIQAWCRKQAREGVRWGSVKLRATCRPQGVKMGSGARHMRITSPPHS